MVTLTVVPILSTWLWNLEGIQILLTDCLFESYFVTLHSNWICCWLFGSGNLAVFAKLVLLFLLEERGVYFLFNSNGNKERSCLGLITLTSACSMSWRICSLVKPNLLPNSFRRWTSSTDLANDFLSSSIACRYSGGRLLLDSVTSNIH